jgi:uncharacterized protein
MELRRRERVAIVGSGIAGMTCAHLLRQHADITLFEADDRLGGHANTVMVEDPDVGSLAIDTGFIVHNDRNYPNLVRLLDELEIDSVDTEMSFAVTDRDRARPFTYRATNLDSLFADRRRLLDPAMWRMLVDILRFYRAGNRYLDDVAADDDRSIGDFLRTGRYRSSFVDLHLIPMGAAVWSADPSRFDEFPAASLLRFLRNHGLLSIGDRPQWRTIVGGSRRYVEAIARGLDTVRTSTPISAVRRTADGVVVTTPTGDEDFDRVILACHSDQALRMLSDATALERQVLGAIGYQPNIATLHTDVSLLSPLRKVWAAWNYDLRGEHDDRATLTYDLTALQHLPGERRYLVSLNSDHLIDPSLKIASFDYAHPVFDGPAIRAQRHFEQIDGVQHTHFCGAYWSFGFHEDGMASGLRVCERMGVSW